MRREKQGNKHNMTKEMVSVMSMYFLVYSTLLPSWTNMTFPLKHCFFSFLNRKYYLSNLKKERKKERKGTNRIRDVENKYIVTRGERRAGGINEGTENDICTLLYIQ